MKPTSLGLFIAAQLFLASTAFAAVEDDLKSGRIIAVDDRPYRMVHEFAIHGGVLPTDARYVGLSLGGSYTLHLSELWAWEAISFHYSANIETNLDSQLTSRFDVVPESEPQTQYFLTTSVVFTPFYGKQALMNKRIALESVYIALGGGLLNQAGDDEDFFVPQVSVGPGIRFFVSQVVSARLDIRGITTFDDVNGQQVDFLLHAFLSVSFNFGKTRATEIGKVANEDTRTGFEKLDELYPKSNPDIVVIEEKRSDD